MSKKCLLRRKERLLLATGFVKFDGTNKPDNDDQRCWCILNDEVHDIDAELIEQRTHGYAARTSGWAWHTDLSYSIAYFKLV